MRIDIEKLKKDLKEKSNPKKAEILQRFFKTGKGQYGEGDIFFGVMVPEKREIVKKYQDKISLEIIQELLKSKIHEHRSIALSFLVHKYKKAENKKKIVDFYLKNLENVNNWDLVDSSAPNILGAYLSDKKRDILYELLKSANLWDRRISMISTFSFIRENDFKDALKIAEKLLQDEHDLMHKAVGWVLREVGKKDVKVLEGFLKKHYKNMPRTMLRYSIEKFPEEERKKWLRGEM